MSATTSVHDRHRLADAEATNGVRVEAERDGLPSADIAEFTVDAALDDPELGLAGVRAGNTVAHHLEPAPRPLRPPERSIHRAPRVRDIARVGDALIEDHRHVRAKLPLQVRDPLGRQQVFCAVQMRAESRTLVVDGSMCREAEHLIPAAVGQDRPWPPDEAMQSTMPRDEIRTRAKVKMIRVGQEHLRAELDQVPVQHGPDRATCPDRHERGCLDDPVRSRQLGAARRAVAMRHLKIEGGRHTAYTMRVPRRARRP